MNVIVLKLCVQIIMNQLRKHLEPENTSLQSKTKSIAANSQHVHQYMAIV